jgi:hypothetical protein
MDLNSLNYHDPLEEYPWKDEINCLLTWLKNKDISTKCFCFDMVMSLAYIDSTSGLERYIESCPSLPNPYNGHLGFINMCAPCYEGSNHWIFQKAAKPESGSIGKLSSEVIVYFIKYLSDNITSAKVVGGTEYIDACLELNNGDSILCEVKSAPLLTYPIVFSIKQKIDKHIKISMTSSQLRNCDAGLYLHNNQIIPLGKVGNDLWPFRQTIEYIIDKKNLQNVRKIVATWEQARKAYILKDREDKIYYLTNACGNPPKIAKDQDNWPKNESISDSKTSAGMDRTDDIKKGIYQVIKIGTEFQNNKNIKTAIISNLPAYRHGNEYVLPFNDMLWGKEKDLIGDKEKYIPLSKLRRVYDYIITIDDPVLRDIKL